MLACLLWTLALLLSAEQAECVRCYQQFNMSSGVCEKELGEVGEEECCQNSLYGYKGSDGVCRYCGSPMWSPWRPWGDCSVSCGEGVHLRIRKCFGGNQPRCPGNQNTLEAVPCLAPPCCPVEPQWGSWGPWGECSAPCGGTGVRRRERICPKPGANCFSSCQGSSEETEDCSGPACPVHGSWSSWSAWVACSGQCIQGKPGSEEYPFRTRQRSCTNPAPSHDTQPPGNQCQGKESEVQQCTELPNCPVDGSWGPYGPPGPCSVTCGEGVKLSIRRCDKPAPRYGGRQCSGLSTQVTSCYSNCPVHGGWSGWSSWGECSTSCIPDGGASLRVRRRSCTNPAPSSEPLGNSCLGEASQTENCDRLPPCAVDGGWGPWSAWSACSVTCGVGQQQASRTCNRPTPKHGGRPCQEAASRSRICNTNIPCPVDGVWSSWSSWGECKGSLNRKIICKKYGGIQWRERFCSHPANNGSICVGDLTDRRVCFNIKNCMLNSNWGEWSPWSVCNPGCGSAASQRTRTKSCEPDLSEYPKTIGRQREPANFYGSPLVRCNPLPDGESSMEHQPCLNLPDCPDED